MKNIKYLFLFLVIFLFCGCSVKYDLNIDDDLSVTEKVEATEKEITVRANTGMETDKAVDYLSGIYKRDGIKPSITSKIDGKNIIGTASTSHKSIDDYAKNFTSDIFDKVKLSKSGNIYSLTFKQTDKLTSESSIGLVYDKVTISITVPYKVTKHNADRVYKNTYTWDLSKNQELRNLKITFDTTKKRNSTVLDLGFFKLNVNYGVLVLITFILLILATVIVVYLNNKKNNRF